MFIGENGDPGGIFRSMSFLKWTGKVVKSPKEILFFKIIPSCPYLCCVFSIHRPYSLNSELGHDE